MVLHRKHTTKQNKPNKVSQNAFVSLTKWAAQTPEVVSRNLFAKVLGNSVRATGGFVLFVYKEVRRSAAVSIYSSLQGSTFGRTVILECYRTGCKYTKQDPSQKLKEELDE